MVSRLEPTVETTRRSIDLRLDLHSPLFVIGDLSRVTKLHEEAEALARELGDHARLGRVLVRLANYSWAGAQYADARHRSTQALTIGLKTGDRVLEVMGRYLLGEVQHACGEYPAAIRSFRENVEGDNSEVAKQRLGFTASPYVVSCGFSPGVTPCWVTSGQRVHSAIERSPARTRPTSLRLASMPTSSPR